MNLPNGGDKQVINDQNKAPQHHNHYDLSYPFAATERFGEINPFVFAYGVPDDKNFTFRIKQTLRTMSLKSPLLQNLKKNLDFYAVPTRAILPHTWDFLQSNPVIGEDVDANDLNCLLTLKDDSGSSILDLLFVSGFYPYEDGEDTTGQLPPALYRYLHMFALWNLFFAKDSLFAAFRMPLSDRCGVRPSPSIVGYKSPDEAIQLILSEMWKFYHFILVNIQDRVGVNPTSIVFLDDQRSSLFTRNYDFSQLEERMRFYYDFIENPNIRFPEQLDGPMTQLIYSAARENLNISHLDSSFIESVFDQVLATDPFDIRPIIAYQLVCAEYFTNDHIDFVYSADMFRKIYEGYFLNIDGSIFTLNGNNYPYDAFSSFALHRLLSVSFDELSQVANVNNWIGTSLLITLISRKRSLRYVDYFTGARSRPLAVGDVNITITDNKASAIDVSKGLQSARYLLAVNRVGPKGKSYLKGIFGSNMRTQTDVPVKIGHLDEVIYGVETQNTGSDQMSDPQSITTNLMSKSSDFAFQMDLEEDTLLVGVSSYEIERFYLQGWSKFANKRDRFDWFNPYFQYTGDQPILQSELAAGLPDEQIFGYQSKDTEYKLAPGGYAIGDFRNALRGWIFAQSDIKENITISPDFIRAHQTELDRYFLQFTGVTSCDRYHFICFYENKIEASRNMIFDPQILK